MDLNILLRARRAVFGTEFKAHTCAMRIRSFIMMNHSNGIFCWTKALFEIESHGLYDTCMSVTRIPKNSPFRIPVAVISAENTKRLWREAWKLVLGASRRYRPIHTHRHHSTIYAKWHTERNEFASRSKFHDYLLNYEIAVDNSTCALHNFHLWFRDAIIEIHKRLLCCCVDNRVCVRCHMSRHVDIVIARAALPSAKLRHPKQKQKTCHARSQ